MQPHFPGYPYFILGGMFINKWIVNPAQALSIWNSILLLTTIYPVYALSRSYLSKTSSVVAVAIIQSMVFLNVMTIQPMSEASAVAILWWYIWVLNIAFQRTSTGFVVLSSLLFSFLLGIRLSYLPFGIGLLFLLLSRRKQYKMREYLSFLVIQIGIALLFQLIWVAGLAVSEGGVAAFVQLALGFSTGHFQDWGGTAVSASSTLYERVLDLFIHNIMWTGSSGQSILLIVLLGLLTLVGANNLSNKTNISYRSPFGWAYVLMFISYLLWALFAQNIDKPRHILPLPTMMMFSLVYLVCINHNFLRNSVIILLIGIVLTQTVLSYNVMKEGTKPAAVHQLIDFLEDIEEPVIVYTWEETRVMEYVDTDFEHEQIYTYSTFQSDKSYYENHRIFLTGEVVDGFKEQGSPIVNAIKKVKDFHSSSIYDPVYDDIVLYEYRE